MGKASIILACVAAAAVLAGCRESVQVASLKDHAPTSGIATTEQPKPELPVVDRARSEQSATCGQRHVEHHSGRLNETEEQKRTTDATCAELHRYDHMR